MAAVDEFPRGITHSVRTLSANAQVIIPAAPGIAHVVTSVLVDLSNFAATSSTNDACEISDDLTGRAEEVALIGGTGVAGDSAVGGGDIQFMGSVGGSVTVTFGAVTNWYTGIHVTWHDV